MGFRTGAYATIWKVEPVSDTVTKVRLSISRKNRQTDAYEEDFSGYTSFYGTANAKKAAALRERDRVKLGDVDVRSHYDKGKGVTYYNFNVFSFEQQTQGNTVRNGYDSSAAGEVPSVDDGEVDSRLPF